jgi:hypothetical protein
MYKNNKTGNIIRHIDGQGTYGATWSNTTPELKGGAISMDPKYQGLRLEYSKTNATGDKLTAIKEEIHRDEINYNWGAGKVLNSDMSDNIRLDFNGLIKMPIDGKIQFRTLSDDGVRLYINNENIINLWKLQGPTYAVSPPQTVNKDQIYPFKLEWYEHQGGAVLSLQWAVVGTNKWSIVPKSAFLLLIPPVDNTGSSVELAYNLKAWSGGWRSDWCPDKDYYTFFGVAVNGKMVVGNAVNASIKRNPLGQGKIQQAPKNRPGRGINLVVLSSDGKLTLHKSYDTFDDSYASGKLVKDLNILKDPTSPSSDSIVIIGVHDEAYNRLSVEAKQMIQLLGGKRIWELQYRSSYLLIYRPLTKLILYEDLNICGDVEYEHKCNLHCRAIYDINYYKGKYADIADKSDTDIQSHWENIGLKEGRRASDEFDVSSYASLYEDLKPIANNNIALAKHYMDNGIEQGRSGVFDVKTNSSGLIINGLQCYLDARDRKSLVKNTSQWRDISENNNHFDFKRAIVTDGMRVNMSTIGIGSQSNKFNIGQNFNGGSYTITMVVRCKVLSQGFALRFKSDLSDHGISFIICGQDKHLRFDNMGQQQSYNMGDSCYDTNIYTFTKTLTEGLDIYINGKRVVKGERGKAIIPNLKGNVELGYNGWNADMSVLLVHNIGLAPKYIRDIHQWYLKTEKLGFITLLDEIEQQSKTIFKDDIPLRGLTFALDAGDKRCYNGNSIKDISGNNRPVTLLKTLKVQNNAWVFDGDNNILGPPSVSLGMIDDYTIVVRASTTKLVDSILLELAGFKLPALSFTPAYKDGFMYWNQGKGQNIKYESKQYAPVLTTYTMIRDSTGRHLYIDEDRVYSTPDRGTSLITSVDPLRIAKSTSGDFFIGLLSHLMLYRTALTATQVQQINRYVNNPYIIRDSTWKQALQTCAQNGSVLCDSNTLCYNGKSVNSSKMKNALVPVGSAQNAWLNLDKCTTTNINGMQKDAHIKCCPIKRYNKYFTAACNFKNTIYFFKDDQVMQYRIKGNMHSSKPAKKITEQFPGIPDSFSSNIEAAGITQDGKMYLFKSTLAMVYDINKKTVDIQPSLITGILGSTQLSRSAISITDKLPADFRGYYDTILTLGNRLVLFKGPEVFLYGRRYKVSNLIPGNIMDTGVDSWMHLSDGNRVATREGYLYHFNTKKMMPLLEYFYDLKPPFLPSDERCHNLDIQLNTFTKARDSTVGIKPELYKIYVKRIKAINKERNEYCQHKSLSDFKSAVVPRKEKLIKLKRAIVDYRDKQTQLRTSTEAHTIQLNKLAMTIADLDKQILYENSKKCPVNQTCEPVNNIKPDNKYNTCSTDMIKQILLKQGYTPQQILQLSSVLDKESSADDYDIRTHKSFNQYTNRTMVKQCTPDRSVARSIAASKGMNFRT